MNQANIIVNLEPTAEQLKAACEGFLVRLNYIVQGPCKLTSVVLDSDDWRLNEISINNRFGILSSRYWNACVVLLPGHNVEVTIENMGTYSMPFLVRLELEYANAFDAFPPQPPPTAKEAFQKKIRARFPPVAYPEETPAENMVREFYEKQRAKYPPNIPPGLELLRGSPKEEVVSKEPEPPPPPAPTRFSELDIEDDEPPSS